MCSLGVNWAVIWGPLGVAGGLCGGLGRLGRATGGGLNCKILIFAVQTKGPAAVLGGSGWVVGSTGLALGALLGVLGP